MIADLPKEFQMPVTARDQKNKAHKNRMLRFAEMIEKGQDKSWTQVAIDEELTRVERLAYPEGCLNKK